MHVEHKLTPAIWDIEFDTQVPDASLIAFNQHKETLLAILRSEYERVPKPNLFNANLSQRTLRHLAQIFFWEPFDADQSWRALSHLAQIYFWELKIKPATRPASDHVERLRDLAKAFGRARRKAEKAMQGDLGHDLLRAGSVNNSQVSPFSLAWVPCDDHRGPFDAINLADTLKNVVAGLTTLENAANRAAYDLRTRGRPKGTGVLPSGYILSLAKLYRTSTGHRAGAGNGPFARFVDAFLKALGRSNITNATLIDAIKDARREYGYL